MLDKLQGDTAVLEVISFNQSSNTTLDQAKVGFNILDSFYKGFDGYKSLDVAGTTESGWFLVLKWDSKESEQVASRSMMKSDETNLFKLIVDPTTVDKKLYPVYSF